MDEVGRVCGEGLEDVPALFSRGGYDGSDASEGACACHGSETAGEFHLDLHHSQVPLGLVVGEGDGEVIEEAQDIAFELVEPDQKIVSGAMGRPSARSDPSGEGRQVSMEGKPTPGDGVVAFDQRAQSERRQRRRAFRDRGAEALVGVEEKIAHLPGPLLLVDVDERLELAQVMSVAQGVCLTAGSV